MRVHSARIREEKLAIVAAHVRVRIHASQEVGCLYGTRRWRRRAGEWRGCTSRISKVGARRREWRETWRTRMGGERETSIAEWRGWRWTMRRRWRGGVGGKGEAAWINTSTAASDSVGWLPSPSEERQRWRRRRRQPSFSASPLPHRGNVSRVEGGGGLQNAGKGEFIIGGVRMQAGGPVRREELKQRGETMAKRRGNQGRGDEEICYPRILLTRAPRSRTRAYLKDSPRSIPFRAIFTFCLFKLAPPFARMLVLAC